MGNQNLSGSAPSLPLHLEIAVKTNIDVFYLTVRYDLSAVLNDGGPVGQDAFQQVFFRQAPPESKLQVMGQFSQQVTPPQMLQRSGPGIQLTCLSDAAPLVPLFQDFLQELLRVRWQGGAPGGNGPPQR